MISIVLCHHTGRLIERCLDSIRKSVGVEYEIIVVADYFKDWGDDVKLYICKDGPAYKRNFGRNFAKGEYLCFLDDDTELKPDTLLELKNSLDTCSMVYAKLVSMYDYKTLDHDGAYLGFGGFLLENTPHKEENVILAGKSACCMIWTHNFDRVGGFDRDFFMFGEETDLSWRLWLQGLIVKYEPKAVCYHAFNTPLKDVKKYYNKHTVHFHGCKNYPTMLIKNLERPTLTVTIHISIWAFICMLSFLVGKKEESKHIKNGLIYLWKNRKLIAQKRKKIQENRLVADKKIFKYIKANTSPMYYFKRGLEYVFQGREQKNSKPT